MADEKPNVWQRRRARRALVQALYKWHLTKAAPSEIRMPRDLCGPRVSEVVWGLWRRGNGSRWPWEFVSQVRTLLRAHAVDGSSSRPTKLQANEDGSRAQDSRQDAGRRGD